MEPGNIPNSPSVGRKDRVESYQTPVFPFCLCRLLHQFDLILLSIIPHQQQQKTSDYLLLAVIFYLALHEYHYVSFATTYIHQHKLIMFHSYSTNMHHKQNRHVHDSD